VPILDVAFAIVRRTVRGTSFAERDLGHLHHRLVRLGHGHRRAVLILWAWTAVLSVFVLLVTFGLHYSAFVPFGALFLVAVLYTAFLPGSRASEPTPRVGGPEGGESEDVPVDLTGAAPISVVVSAAAGVAVAGEPDLASPKRRRRRRIVRRGRGQKTAPHDETGIGTQPAHFARPGDEMRG